MTQNALSQVDLALDKILACQERETIKLKRNVTTERKRLNNLDGKEWVKNTKSVWMETPSDSVRHAMLSLDAAMQSGVLLSEAPPRDALKKSHPATFSETDIAKLIRFFTKEGEIVLDPFLGSGSSALASIAEKRRFVGVELYPEWHAVACQRISAANGHDPKSCYIHLGDSLKFMSDMNSGSVDFVVTSPPYWGILEKKDHKAKSERVAKGLATQYGNAMADLARIDSYDQFLIVLERHFLEYHRLLRAKRYAAIIVSDFRHGSEYYMFHAHVADSMRRAGFTLQGLISLVQDNKKLYPYGFPSAYVPNISNQFIVIGRKI